MRLVSSLSEAIVRGWEYTLNTGQVIEQKNWQGIKSPRPMFEALDYDFKTPMPKQLAEAREHLQPNLPWADLHFKERIGGEPLNPPPSHKQWPFANKDNKEFTQGGKFSHTYPERFWPKHARASNDSTGEEKVNKGIRFVYGDFLDVLYKLNNDPTTRQAFLPIWFPEDTGKRDNIRVPCSIGYHFLIRKGRLDITYWMRSLDMIRHFQDDIYLCWRLAEFTSNYLGNLELGYMKFHAVSCHIFDGEQKLLENKIRTWRN